VIQRSTSLVGVLLAGAMLCVNVPAPLHAADTFDGSKVVGAVIQPRLLRDDAVYRHWEMRLPEAGGGPAMDVHIWTRGAKAVQLAARAEKLKGWRDLDLSGLTTDGNSLKGKVVFHAHDGGQKSGDWPQHRWSLELDLSAGAEGKLTGTAIGFHATASIGKDITHKGKELVHVREVLRQREEIFGNNSHPIDAAVEGWVRESKAMRGADPWPAGADWTHWLGTEGTLRGKPAHGPLVHEPGKAVLAWKAERHLLNGGKSHVSRYGGFGSATRRASGGGASPVIADGKVYLYWFEPNGPFYNRKEEAKRAPSGHFIKSMWQTLADDHVACFDATTGQRLWEAVYPLAGMTFFYGKSGLVNSTPAVAESALVAVGGAGRVYCLDPKTGRQRWQALLPYHEDVVRRYGLTGQGAGGRARPHAVTVAAGRAYVADERGGLLAFALGNGNQEWCRKYVLGQQVTPQAWQGGGTALLLTQNDGGTVLALDPATGEDRWRIEGLPEHQYKTINNYVQADMLLVQSAHDEKAPKGRGRSIAGFRISATGAEKAWELPGERYCWPHNGGASMAALDEHRAAIMMGKSSGGREGLPALIVIDVRSGKVLQERSDGDRGFTYNMSVLSSCGDLLIVHGDINHSSQEFHGFRITAGGLELLWTGHHFGHFETSSYEVPTANPFVDGRLFVRGAFGLYCYDFRASATRPRP